MSEGDEAFEARRRPGDRAPYVPPPRLLCQDRQLPIEERAAPSWLCSMLAAQGSLDEVCPTCLPFARKAPRPARAAEAPSGEAQR